MSLAEVLLLQNVRCVNNMKLIIAKILFYPIALLMDVFIKDDGIKTMYDPEMN